MTVFQQTSVSGTITWEPGRRTQEFLKAAPPEVLAALEVTMSTPLRLIQGILLSAVLFPPVTEEAIGDLNQALAEVGLQAIERLRD